MVRRHPKNGDTIAADVPRLANRARRAGMAFSPERESAAPAGPAFWGVEGHWWGWLAGPPTRWCARSTAAGAARGSCRRGDLVIPWWAGQATGRPRGADEQHPVHHIWRGRAQEWRLRLETANTGPAVVGAAVPVERDGCRASNSRPIEVNIFRRRFSHRIAAARVRQGRWAGVPSSTAGRTVESGSRRGNSAALTSSSRRSGHLIRYMGRSRPGRPRSFRFRRVTAIQHGKTDLRWLSGGRSQLHQGSGLDHSRSPMPGTAAAGPDELPTIEERVAGFDEGSPRVSPGCPGVRPALTVDGTPGRGVAAASTVPAATARPVWLAG